LVCLLGGGKPKEKKSHKTAQQDRRAGDEGS
jgi:hypothetical protein